MIRLPFRHLLMALSVLAGGPVLSVAAAAEAPAADPIAGYATEKIAEGLYTFRWGASRSLFMVTRNGVIATDPMNNAAAAAYRQEIAKITPLPVKVVVYSHSHK